MGEKNRREIKLIVSTNFLLGIKGNFLLSNIHLTSLHCQSKVQIINTCSSASVGFMPNVLKMR